MTEPWGYQEVQGYVGNESKESNSKEIEELKSTKVDGAEYKKDENKISLTAEGKEVASIDTTDFVKDGMVESVELDGTVLKMVFNTDAGKEEIDIDFKDIVSGGSYYTKDEVDEKLDEKADKSDIPSLDEYAKTADVQSEIENAVSGKADASDVYTKDEADAKLDEKADKADIPSLDEYAKSADVQAEIENAVSGKVDASDVYTKDEVDEKLDEKADKSDIPSMDEYAKADDVQAEIDNAVSGKADSSDVEAVEAQITQILSDITALNGKDDELQANIDLKAGQNDLVAEAERASAKESEIEENVAKKVDWVESTPGRNHIVLKNHDSLLGTATDGATYNVAMVSKWDVADFGSAQLHANLNSKDGIVTINDDKAIATKDEVEAVDAKVEAIDLTSYAKSEDVNAELANKANASDITALNGKDEELQAAIDLKASQEDFEALSGNVYTKEESDDKFLTEHQSLSGYATEEWVNEQGFLTEHQDISNLATKDEVESGLTDLWTSLNLAAEKIDTKADADVVFTKDEVDALLLAKENEIYNLTKIVGDIGGAVTYELPSPAGKSFNTLMGNNGTVKLTDDVTTGRFGPGITAKNKVKLNLNSNDLTVTGLTTSTSQGAIMARGTQEITIYGNGVINAGEGICVQANGADSVINLTGSTTTYRTNRPGGELIYCYSGTINITNGTFRNDGSTNYLLNCYDANYANGTAKIIVTGGKFYDFNPADNSAEGEHTSFVPAEGYTVTSAVVVEDEVEHTVYTVKKV